MKYKLRCLLLCFLFIFSLQGCQKETKLEKPGNLITTTKNSSKENPNTEDPVETVPITGGTTADINSSTGDESNSEISDKDGTVDNSNIHIVNSELKKIPESIMEQFQKNGWHIYVTDADINQKFYQGKYSTVLGTTQYADKKIYIANTSQAATESTIHEVGHFVDYSNGFLSDQEKFKELYLSEVRIYIKAYDAVCVRDRKELFAEVFWQYLTNPSKLQLETPGLYFYMKNTLHTFYSF